MINLYRPNSKNTGFAASFRYSQEKDCVFAQLIKQSTWDAQNHIGGFKESVLDPKKKVTVALGLFELGAIVDCLERNRPFKVFHDDGKNTGGKSVAFEPWMSKDNPPVHKGYSFSVTVNDKEDINNKNVFYIGIGFGEGRAIKEYLLWAMRKSFKNDMLKNQPKSVWADITRDIPKIDATPTKPTFPPNQLLTEGAIKMETSKVESLVDL